MRETPEARANAKKAAARCASGMAYASTVLGVGALAVGLVGGAVIPGVILGVGSLVAAAMSTSYSDLAIDPPRKDFNVVALRPPRDIQHVDWATDIFTQANVIQLELARVIQELVISLERYDGAVSTESSAFQNNDKYARVQLEAIRYHSWVAARHHRDLLYLIPACNIFWHEQIQKLGSNPKAPTAESVREFHSQHTMPKLRCFQDRLGWTDEEVEFLRPKLSHLTDDLKYKPKVVDLPFGDDIYITLQEVQSSLTNLVATG